MSQNNSEERRQHTRFLACFPASVVPPDGLERPSLIRDLSVTGALLLVHSSKLSVGDEVELHLYLTAECTNYRVEGGRVVRVERLSPDVTGPWSRRVAVEFDKPLSDREEEIAEMRKALGIDT